MIVNSVMATEFQTASLTSVRSVSFEGVFSEYYGPIYSYVLRMIGNSEDAQDLTVTSFEKAFKAWNSQPANLQVRPWLYRIATNTCLDELRHRRLIRWLPLDLFNGSTPHPVSREDPEESLLKAEDARIVRQALAKLPERYRVALILRESQGLSCDEIGQSLGISRSATKVLLFRAREKLRQIYFLEPEVIGQAIDESDDRDSSARADKTRSIVQNPAKSSIIRRIGSRIIPRESDATKKRSEPVAQIDEEAENGKG